MQALNKTLRNLLIVAGLAVPVIGVAMGNNEPCPMDKGGPMGAPHHGPMGGPGPMMEGGDHLPPFLGGLELSEAQRDQIFKITYDNAPALRDKAKAIHKAQTELHKLTFSSQYDEAKVKALAQAAAQASADMTVLRTAEAHKIFLVLTPEQRKKAEEMKADFERRGPGAPRDGGPGERRDDRRGDKDGQGRRGER